MLIQNEIEFYTNQMTSWLPFKYVCVLKGIPPSMDNTEMIELLKSKEMVVSKIPRFKNKEEKPMNMVLV